MGNKYSNVLTVVLVMVVVAIVGLVGYMAYDTIHQKNVNAQSNTAIQEFENKVRKRVKSGNDVEDNTGMRQVLGYIMFFTDVAHHTQYIDEINNTVKVISETGEDMLVRYRFEKGYAVE